MTDGFSRRQFLKTGSAGAAALAAAPVAAQVAASTAPATTPSLAGKSILITGAASGFGHLGALLYARAGAKVIATMRRTPRAEAEALRTAARTGNLDLHVVDIDVLSDRSVERGVAEAQRIAGGAIDVLVNNAAVGISGPVELQDMAATTLAFDTNVFGYQRMVRAVLPAMRARRQGLIFNISSQLGRLIAPNLGHYCASKFAVEALSEQLAYELAPRGVEVVVIQPGGYPTEIWSKGRANTQALIERTENSRKAGYPELMQSAVRSGGGGGITDPLDVPRAIAEIIAMAPGTRPLRRAVHPGPKPQERINQVSAETQRAMLGRGPFAPWVEAVLG